MAKLNHHISIILLATILGFTYEIHQIFGEQPGWKIILFVLICLALSETIANSLAALLCNSSLIRRIYMGRNWIEGWWYLQSIFPDSTVVAGEDVLGVVGQFE